ncbi:TPA: hypothetical protein ITS68_001396 [Enterococcus faecalis]|nr:hypothetical protein [Enterococcus faecalis]HAP3007300.1 hypothetical protein [Enterococcus faecalis]
MPLTNKVDCIFFKSIIKEFIRPEVISQLHETSVEKLNLLISITLFRFSYSDTEKIDFDHMNYPYLRYFLKEPIDITHPEAELCQEQRLIINIIARTAIANLDTEESILSLFNELKKNKATEYQYITDLFAHFCRVYAIEMTKYDQLLYTFWLFKLYICNQLFVTKQPTTSLSAFSVTDDPELVIEITDFFNNYKKTTSQFAAHFKNTEKTVWTFELLMHIKKKFADTSFVRIGINYTRDFDVCLEIHSKITQVFNNDKIKFEFAEFHTCDLVISDHPIFDLPSNIKKFYILDESFGTQDWQQIFWWIGELITSKQLNCLSPS